jgi:hypothetical protein
MDPLGEVKFHYDAALARQPSDEAGVHRGSWAQLPGSQRLFVRATIATRVT